MAQTTAPPSRSARPDEVGLSVPNLPPLPAGASVPGRAAGAAPAPPTAAPAQPTPPTSTATAKKPATTAKPSPVPVAKSAGSWGAAIEGLAAYDPQRTCDATAKPGTIALRDFLLARYP